MGRFYYLKHQITAWNDPRIQAMVEQEGAKAYGTYWYIIEKLSILPEPRAELKYLKHFVEKGFSYSYMVKIVMEFGLFKVEDGYFTNLDLNIRRKKEPSSILQKEGMKNEGGTEDKTDDNRISHTKSIAGYEEKNTEKDEKRAENQGFTAVKKHFLDEKMNFCKLENEYKLLNNSTLEKISTHYKENIENKTTTTTEEKEETAVAADKTIDSFPVITDNNPVSPVRAWQQLVDDMRQDSMWTAVACMKCGYGVLLKLPLNNHGTCSDTTASKVSRSRWVKLLKSVGKATLSSG